MMLSVLAGLWLIGAPPAVQVAMAEDDVVVTEQAARPEVVSGVYAAFVLVQARRTDGEVHRFYFPYMSETQEIPQPGARCYFWSVPRRIELVGGYASPPDLEGDVVTAFDCGPRPIDETSE